MERFEKEVAGAVAGESSASAVATVRSWSKSNNQKLRIRIAESGNWSTPVFPILKRAALGMRHGFAKTYQARTLAARNDLFVEDSKFVFCRQGHSVRVRMISAIN